MGKEAVKELGATVLEIETFLTRRTVVSGKWVFIERLPVQTKEAKSDEKA